MSFVSNIIDSLRRVGGATQKSALRRQDAQLEGMHVLERRQINIRDGRNLVNAFVATVAPAAETVVELTEDELRSIGENVEYGCGYLAAFVAPGADKLEDLDEAFRQWSAAQDKRGYSNEDVIELVGAMFGTYCCQQLNMRWIKVTDAFGTALAIEGIESEFRGFPYQTVSKRIADSEHGFLKPIFVLLKHQSAEARPRFARK